MAKFNQFEVWRVELPVQEVVRKWDGKTINVNGTEMHSGHRCVVVAADPDGQWAVIIPLTSAQYGSNGGEKWANPKKTWVRVIHDGKPAYALTEQIRYADSGRFFEKEGELGQFDQQQVELKLRALLGHI